MVGKIKARKRGRPRTYCTEVKLRVPPDYLLHLDRIVRKQKSTRQKVMISLLRDYYL
jgi:hypothetical protein